MSLSNFLIIFVIVFFAMVPISMLVEKIRPRPRKPEKLPWAEDIALHYFDVDGVNIRYIKTGEGPVLLLLHTLRTQLDIFQKMIPELSQSFTVYAMDYPGHGWSDIPSTDYTADFFVNSVNKFMEELDLNEVLIAGVSIGGSIPLISAGRGNKRITGILAINPYDYPGKGPARGNFVANLMFSIVYLPVLGETFMRLRSRIVEKIIMQGGVADSKALPAAFLEEMFVVGERPDHYLSFINLIRNSSSFCQAHNDYKNIKVPVRVIYGEQDWAKQEERDLTVSAIPAATVEVIENAGHFMSLDQPSILIDRIKDFSNSLQTENQPV
ncbi:MAG: pimeloyl-ACP methyl ester carboxylesterase [Planctomycetota bacterium]